MKAIKVTLYLIAALLVLLVLGVAIFALTFDPNRYKGQIESLVKEKTGRTLGLAGNLEVAVWPSLGAKVNGVTLSERASDQRFLSLDSAHVSVALMPLLSGNVVVDGIRVSGLQANIVRKKDGSFNFSDLLASGQAGAEKPEKKAEPGREQGAPLAFDIAGIHIERSAVSYRDLGSGQDLALTGVNLDTGRIAEQAEGKLSLAAAAKGRNPDMDLRIGVSGLYRFDLPAGSFSLSGLDAKVNGAAAGIRDLSFDARGDVSAAPEKSEYHVKGLTLEASGAMPQQSFTAKASAPQLDVGADRAKGGAISVQATLKQAARNIEAALQLSGVEGSAKSLVIPRLTADIAMSGEGVPQKSVKIPVSGSLRADLEKQTASADLTSKFDESNIQARLGLVKFSPPAYTFDINVDRLNVDRYLPHEEKPVTKPSEGDKPAAKPAAQEDTPVDLSALKDLNANGRLQVGSLQAKGLKLANVKAQVKAANGRLDVAPLSANLYQGSVSGALSAQADGRVAVKQSLSGVAIGPLLRDFAQKDILEGRGNVSLDVTAAGKTVNTMKKALNGTARVQLRDGAIKGINIAEILRRAKTALASPEARAQARETQQTDFSEMSASFAIKNGVAHNDDLDVKAPLFRITGKGDIDIVNSTIDYVTKAAVVATTKGQGGAELSQLAGLTVPVHLSGPLDDMKYKVDYAAVARDAAKSKIGEKLKESLGERLGAGKPGQSGSRLEDKLKGLFGR